MHLFVSIICSWFLLTCDAKPVVIHHKPAPTSFTLQSVKVGSAKPTQKLKTYAKQPVSTGTVSVVEDSYPSIWPGIDVKAAPVSIGADVSKNYKVDWNNGKTQKIVLTADSTIDLNALSAHPVSGWYALKICNGSTVYNFTYKKGADIKPFGLTPNKMPQTPNTCLDLLYKRDVDTYWTLASSTSPL